MCTVIHLIFGLHLVGKLKTIWDFFLNVWKYLNVTYGEILRGVLMTNFLDSIQIRKKQHEKLTSFPSDIDTLSGGTNMPCLHSAQSCF